MKINDFLTENDAINSAKAQALQDKAEQEKHEKELSQVLGTVSKIGTDVVSAIDKKTNEVTVSNFPTSISTPDIDKLIPELKKLQDKVEPVDKTTHELLDKLLTAIENIPRDMPEMPSIEFPSEMSVNNQIDYKQPIQDVVDAVKAIKVVYDPKITVKPADVKVNNDYKSLERKLDLLGVAIKAISIVVPEKDNKEMLKRISNVTKAINSLSFPVPNYVLPFKRTDGSATQALVDTTGRLVNTTEKAPSTNYTWTGGYLTQKVETYSDRTVTTDYTWVTGELTEKTVTTT